MSDSNAEFMTLASEEEDFDGKFEIGFSIYVTYFFDELSK